MGAGSPKSTKPPIRNLVGQKGTHGLLARSSEAAGEDPQNYGHGQGTGGAHDKESAENRDERGAAGATSLAQSDGRSRQREAEDPGRDPGDSEAADDERQP